MTNIISLAEALGPVRELYTEPITAALDWQRFRDGPPFPADHFALVCVGADSAFDPDVGPLRWTRTQVFHVLHCAIPNWCARAGCLLPVELPEVMWRWFDFLDETGLLEPGSDPLGELRKPLLCYGRLDQRGSPLPRDAPSTIVCECWVPYRETAEILFALAMAQERGGAPPIELLRGLVSQPPRPGRID